MASPIKKPEEIRDILIQACARRELLILATPYLRFESNFVALEENQLHVAATMSHEDAVYGLRTPELLIRFPQGLGFYESPVQMVGMGLHEGRRTLRLSLPKSIRENDQRVAYRVERVGRIQVTFSSPKANLYTATLVDLSVSGAKLHTHMDPPAGEMNPGDRVILSIPLNDEIRIESSAQIRHARGRSMGVQYLPELRPEIQEPLARWVFLRREEERERLARRLEWVHRPEIKPGVLPESSILLVSSDESLEAELLAALENLRPLRRIPPQAQALKDSMLSRPSLLLCHVGEGTLDERRRLKTLLELVQQKIPTLLVGTHVDGATLFELASEWKASSAIAWSPSRAPFFQRLVRGVLRRHLGAGESPLAPLEP